MEINNFYIKKSTSVFESILPDSSELLAGWFNSVVHYTEL